MDASARTYTISGLAPGSEGKQLTVLNYEEYFTKTLNVVKTELIGYDGRFSIIIESEVNELLVLRIEAVNAQFYLGEASSYDVIMDVSKAVPPIKFTNSNWCGLEFENLPESDLNTRLEELNRVHANFYKNRSTDIYQILTEPQSAVKERIKVKNVKVDMVMESEGSVHLAKRLGLSELLVEEFRDSLNAHSFNFNDHNYENVSARYMVAELENIVGRREVELFEDYLKNAEFNRNLEYVEFKRAFYKNIFEQIYQSEHKEKYLTKLYALDLDSALIELDSILPLASKPLEFCLLSGIETGLNLPNVSSREVTLLLELISRKGRKPFDNMASNYRQLLAKGRKGYKPENCVFMDISESIFELQDWEGEIVYLSFFTTWNTESVGHLKRLKTLESKYGNQIKFVSVCMDYDWKEFQDFVIDNRTYNWLFLFGNTDKLLKEKLLISTVPHYLLLSPKGEFLMDYTPSPEEGVEATLSKLLR